MKLFIFLAFIVATMATIYQSERLLNQSIDQLELELAAREEKDIFFQNDLDEVMFVNWDCNRKSLIGQEWHEWVEINLGLEKVEEEGGSLSNTEKKEWMLKRLSRRLSPFTKIQPHSFKEETGLDCKSVFVDVWTVKSNGEVNKFASKSVMNSGEMMIVSGTADAAHFDHTYEVCGGEKCGCKRNRCWKNCMGMSKCDTKLRNDSQKEDHFYRHSAAYKKYVDGGRKLSDYSTALTESAKLLYSDGKVKCTQDRECKPSFPCKGDCLLWG